MMRLLLTLIMAAVLWIMIPLPALAQQPQPQTPPPPILTLVSPLPGQAVQGTIPIVGNTDIPGFASAELSFGYASDSTGTWFLLSESSTPVANAKLAEWDTTTISDGNYRIRLAVNLQDGSQQVMTIPGLRVRNYTLTETDTPSPVTLTPVAGAGTGQPGATVAPTSAPTNTPLPGPFIPTALPTNPAQVTGTDFSTYLFRAAAGVVFFFVFLGFIDMYRRSRRRQRRKH